MTYAARRPTGSYSVKSYSDIGLETQVMSATPSA
ncbi:flagellar protein FliS [Bordetella pertussis]|nr:flagellar protein FliS [Bordetella pertussis]